MLLMVEIDSMSFRAQLPSPLEAIHCSKMRQRARAKKQTRMWASTRDSRWWKIGRSPRSLLAVREARPEQILQGRLFIPALGDPKLAAPLFGTTCRFGRSSRGTAAQKSHRCPGTFFRRGSNCGTWASGLCIPTSTPDGAPHFNCIVPAKVTVKKSLPEKEEAPNDGQDRQQHRERVLINILNEMRGLAAGLLDDSLYHEVGAVANIGHGTEPDRPE